MGYKFKPSKSVAKRFKVTRTGKLKRHHSLTSHLMSARSGNKKRMLGRPAILFEGHAKNMRKFLGISGTHPGKIAHDRALRAKEAQKTAAAPSAVPANAARSA
jgi:large subunit ribosomal protein L35